MRILIADDDVTSRLVLAGVLQNYGYEVVATVDGSEAWAAMRELDAPRLAILDWMMPGLTGVDVCRRVRGLGADEPPYLIILTSKGAKQNIVDGLEAGADDYLAKPFDPGELHARVEVGRRMVELQARLGEARHALADEAMHDPLTGALNRRAFSEALSGARSRERRNAHGLAIGVCDIDQFKNVNDTYGHQIGDEVLCGLVQVIGSNLREHDVLGRHGGDEFVILTEQDRERDAAAIYERIRAAVADRPIQTSFGPVSITMSFGVQICSGSDTELELMAAADHALYQAKVDGRNRVCLAPAALNLSGTQTQQPAPLPPESLTRR